MTNYGTIKIPKEDYDRHNQRRKEMGLEWAEYIDSQSPEHDVEVDLSPVLNRLDDLQSQLPNDVAGELR